MFYIIDVTTGEVVYGKALPKGWLIRALRTLRDDCGRNLSDFIIQTDDKNGFSLTALKVLGMA